ncbi:MAG TPA: CaiB/BaiF CoA-transferase family protein [Thermoanaerobaculales bacterium]|nr:CaiB/BaiF CoA-transferase family protein [Thermoanaerobaculales bacterium]
MISGPARRLARARATRGGRMAEGPENGRPLAGMVVLDMSRMLPGAVLARQLVDLGARLIKVEEPGLGDPMRMVPPLVGGVGAGYAALLRGSESVALDLRDARDVERVRALAGRADVLVESFRPGTMERRGLGWDALSSANPRLVWCSLSGYGRSGAAAARVGHDLNFIAECGALRELCSSGVPGLQVADIGAALLAATAVLAALLDRERHGRGRFLDQPLAAGPLPFVAWAWAEAAAGGAGPRELLLSGRCPCYRTYVCGDGAEIAVAAVEPKFWAALVTALSAPELTAAGWDVGEEGAAAAARLAEIFAGRPRAHWLRLALELGLPVGPVHTAAEAQAAAAGAGQLEATPAPGGGTIDGVAPFVPSLGRTPATPVGAVGEHTARVLAEFGIP